MNISQKGLQSNPRASIPHNTHIFVAVLLCVVGIGCFGLGRLSQKPILRTAVAIEEAYLPPADVVTATVCMSEEAVQKGDFVASKNGSKYHFTWCGSAKRIKEANKVWFATREEAEAAGYTPAANCKGL